MTSPMTDMLSSFFLMCEGDHGHLKAIHDIWKAACKFPKYLLGDQEKRDSYGNLSKESKWLIEIFQTFVLLLKD